ncbi:MAG TPA: amino acid adenylation domain-containing protein, partial [Thermoanaerobaculia bacterium]|nr:amino acid adenylation domain-containing protein [Thermoanaerobaculia bacterium]
HSLLATQVVSRVRQAFGVELPIRDLFEEPTVAGLAGRLGRLGRTEVEAPSIVPVPRQADLPLSFAQQRLWFLHRLAPDSAVYNVPLAVRLSGRLDAAALAGALRGIGRRHEALRTTFDERQGHPVQVIEPEPRLTLTLLDLSDLPPAEREAEVLRQAHTEALAPFDPAAGPLVRATLLVLGEEEHTLLVTMHHIVTDGWSMGIFLRELTALYAGRELPELPVQYGDFAAWQRAWLSGEVLESQISYWRERLAGAPVRLTLPTDRPRPAVETHRGASLPVTLPPELSQSLTALARREGATPFMILMAGFAVLLGRYSGQGDVVVGAPIAGRNRREIEGLIGFFVNTLALRVELADEQGFLDLVRQVRRTALDAYAHQDIPFERLVEELVTERDLSHSPLFQVVLTLQSASVSSEGGGVTGLELRPVEVESGTAKFELSLGFAQREEELAGSLEYNTDLFDTATAERLARHLARLLEGAAGSPGLRLAELPLLDESERQQLLQEWGQGLATPANDQPVHRLVAARAAETPDAVALVSAAGHAVTYGELSRRAARLARRLRSLGAGPEERVGVLLDRSPEEVTSLLAVLTAGGAYVPLDPAWPRERVELVLADAGVRALLTTSDRSDLPGPILLVDRVWDEPYPGSSEASVDVNHLAYVIYTSGSTGRPKGVEITHRGLLRLLAWHRRAFGVTAADRATRLSGLAFDAAVWELWPYLAAGASVHVPDEETRSSPPALRDWLLGEEITIGFVSTPVAEALLPLPWPASTSLRVLLTGGDRLHRDPGPLPFTLVNNYGPTESTVVATSGPVQARGPGRAPDIGQPIDGTRVLLLERELRLVPPGVAGEICIGGPGLARGYLGQPGLTAERFLPDPFTTDPGERLYRTGDLARHLPDGTIDFLGRIDFQVKIRGLRIELGEIEAALAAHPQVRDAAVLVREDRSGQPGLVVYLAAHSDAGPEELRRWLRGRLPEAMVPPSFVLLESLPLTPNGKLDRKALAGIGPAREEGGGPETYVAPRTPAEEVLAGIFAEVLGQERVGIHDGFFELGGHSLLATQVVSRVRQAFGVELAIRELFEAPTVARLAERIERIGTSTVEAPPIVPVPRDRDLPPSFAQQRLWFVDRLKPGSS